MSRRTILCLLPFLFAACSRDQGVVLARVDSRAITFSDFARELDQAPAAGGEYLKTPAGKKELLELLVRRQLIMSEADQAQMTERPDIKKKLADLDEDFLRQRQEARDRMVVGELLRQLKEGPLKVTDEDVKNVWSTDKEAKASHILLSDEAKAKEVRALLDKGEPFAAVAAKYSEDPGTAKNGGELGFLMRGSLEPSFEDALFNLPVGGIAGPLTTPYGFHIIKKTGERPVSTRPLDEKLQQAIRTRLENQKFQTWLAAAKKRHAVTMDVALLEKAASPALPPSNPRQ